MDPEEDGDHGFEQRWKPRAQPQQFDDTTVLLESLRHLHLVAELKGWTDCKKGMYLGVSQSGLALKIVSLPECLGGSRQ